MGVLLAVSALELRLRTVGDWPEVSEVNSPGIRTFRILALGDSITKGLAKDGDYATELENTLNAANLCYKFEVINRGMPGAETYDLQAQIEDLFFTYRPRAVITMIGGDDQNFWRETDWRFRLRSALRRFRSVKMFNLFARRFWANFSEFKFPGEEEESESLERVFSDFFETGLDNADYSHRFGVHLRQLGRFNEAIAFHRRMLDRFPGHNGARIELGYIFQELNQYSMAEHYFKDAIELSQKNRGPSAVYTWAYFALGELYEKKLHDPKRAESIYLEALNVFPKWHFAYIFLSSFYKNQNQPRKQMAVLRLGLKNCPEDVRLYLNLANLLQERGDAVEAKRLNLIAARLWQQSKASRFTQAHYRALSKKILGIGAIHIAMSYPMQPLDFLRGALENQPDLYFVDNQESFREAVSQNGYAKYFLDDFGGNFGHLTPLAAKLLASNVAEVMIPVLDRLCRKAPAVHR